MINWKFWEKKDNRIDKIIINKQKVKIGVKKSAQWLNLNYKNKKPIIIGILKGCIPFIGTILPLLKFDFEIDFMSASSFKGGTDRQELVLSLVIKTDITDRDVIILEDIIDTANTLTMVIKMLKERNPKSIKIVTLLDKPETRQHNLKPDFAAFKIPNKFIVGFGLDYQEIMRNLPYIGTLKKEYIQNDKVKSKND